MAAQQIQQVLAINTDGEIIEISRESKTLDDTLPPTIPPKRSETIVVGSSNYEELAQDRIKKISGMNTRMLEQVPDLDAIVTELMAGNPEVDIYIFNAGWPVTQRIKELGLYEPLNQSEIISEYVGKCFDYIREAATNDNGEIWMLPLYEYCNATWYIPENMQHFEIEPKELSFVDSYIEVLEQLQGKLGNYRYYNQAATFWYECDILYEVNYNNYKTGEINFDTELYRKLAGFFWPGWDRYDSAMANHPLFYNVSTELKGEVWTAAKAPEFDKDTVIFKTSRVDEHLSKLSNGDKESLKKVLEDWRVMPFPKLASESEQNVIYLYYAYVNPYSKQKEAAIKYLETIAENQKETVKIPSFLRADKEYYKDSYDITIPVFDDLYEIFKNSEVYYRYSWDLSDSFVTDYQRGLISFDEAIKRRQQQAVTGLYE